MRKNIKVSAAALAIAGLTFGAVVPASANPATLPFQPFPQDWFPTLELPYPAGVVAGDPAGVVTDERSQTDRIATHWTADGYLLTVEKTQEVLNYNQPLDGGYTTAEAFGSVTGNSRIEGDGIEPLNAGTFEVGYQIGCGVGIESMNVGVNANLGVSPSASVGSSVGVKPSAGVDGNLGVKPSVGVKPSAGASAGAEASSAPSVSINGGVKPTLGASAGADGDASVSPSASVDGDASISPEVGVNGDASISPSASADLVPGGITNITLTNYDVNLEKRRAAGGFTGTQLKIEGCVGPVSVRSYVVLSTVSETSVDSVAVYGEPRRIR